MEEGVTIAKVPDWMVLKPEMMLHLIREHEKLGRTLTEEETVTLRRSLGFEITHPPTMNARSKECRSRVVKTATVLFAKPCLSRAISLARWSNFLLAIHQASAGHFNKVSRLRQVFSERSEASPLTTSPLVAFAATMSQSPVR
jgi:hypothetical protein